MSTATTKDHFDLPVMESQELQTLREQISDLSAQRAAVKAKLDVRLREIDDLKKQNPYAYLEGYVHDDHGARIPEPQIRSWRKEIADFDRVRLFWNEGELTENQ
jgi:hypothetical protein